ncbi:hypothetical protein SAMN05444339_11013 [Loktanella atrilutea]|uniref:Uncharacterized protein n=1 Tax=Loktanella atrilutea TaxID=366533 RepID=A0A1M5DJ81_LOKAT|nr:hypothetical protein [Loktanella atrilutea]SHF66951.1 hypothetical protein SAMN05444339_11013 [Loktanella atrilutea]
MDDDENEATLIEELRTEAAAQKATMLAILRVIEDQRPGATILVAQDLAEQADRVGQIDPALSEALWDLSDEIRVRG